MLTIQVILTDDDFFDETTGKFLPKESFELTLEHSLASLSKWEEKFEKPFLGPVAKTYEETVGYIEAMTLTPKVPPLVYLKLTPENFEAIRAYIDAKMTATTIKATKEVRRKEVITSEIIYYWMISLNIPVTPFEHWHLNRLLTFIQVVNEKNSPPKKRSAKEMADERRKLNAERMAKYNTTG